MIFDSKTKPTFQQTLYAEADPNTDVLLVYQMKVKQEKRLQKLKKSGYVVLGKNLLRTYDGLIDPSKTYGFNKTLKNMN